MEVIMSRLYPVKIYDGEGNLLRIISVEELKKKANEDFKNFGYIAKQKQQKKINLDIKESQRKKEELRKREKENINLNTDGMQGGEQCNDALSNSARESIPPIGKLKDILGGNGSE